VGPNGITAKKICDENGLMFWPLKKNEKVYRKQVISARLVWKELM
jgi:hypothetical protein